jgi:lipoprotein-releasing system permease protein
VVKAPFSLFLALRYLKPKRTSVSVITVISILGVTLGIAVLIIVISVMTGFDRELQRKVLGFDAHLIVRNSEPMRDWQSIDEKIRKVPGVVATAPYVMGPVIVEFRDRVITPKIRGIEIEKELKLADLRTMIREGTHDIQSDQCLIGVDMADELGILLQDKITVYAPRNIGQVLSLIERVRKDANDKAALDELKELVLPAELEVVGIFESGRYQYDSEIVLVPLYVGQELYGFQDEIHGLSVRATDPYRLEPVENAMRAVLPLETDIRSWMDLNQHFFDAVRLERNVMFVILFFIVIVAAFCVMNTLITVTVQKRQEIGIMKALGATPGQIVWVFLAQGMIVGVLGNLAGVGLGMVVVRWRNEFKEWLANTLHIEIFPPSIYQFSQIPAEVIPQDVAVICFAAFVICSLASLIPAWIAARLDPVKALRYE